MQNIAAVAAGVGEEEVQPEIAVLFLEFFGHRLRQKAERAEGHFRQVMVLIFSVHDVQRKVFLSLAPGELLVANIGVVRIVEGEPQRQVVIFKKVHQGVHFLGRQTVQGQIRTLVVHQLGTARADPVVRPDAAQQTLAHTDAPAPGGNSDFNARLLHSADGLGIFPGYTLTAARPQRTVDIE